MCSAYPGPSFKIRWVWSWFGFPCFPAPWSAALCYSRIIFLPAHPMDHHELLARRQGFVKTPIVTHTLVWWGCTGPSCMFVAVLAWNLLRKEVWGDGWESASFVMINCVLFSWVVLQNMASEHVRSWQCWYFPVSWTALGPQTIMSHLIVLVSGEQTFVSIIFCMLSWLENLLIYRHSDSC